MDQPAPARDGEFLVCVRVEVFGCGVRPLLAAYCALHVTFIAWHTFKIPSTMRSVAEFSPGLVADATRICESLVPRSLTVMLAERVPLLNSTVRPFGSSATICTVWFLRSRLSAVVYTLVASALRMTVATSNPG